MLVNRDKETTAHTVQVQFEDGRNKQEAYFSGRVRL